ncbi:hypothetical protein HDA32_002332 [Spinactinospora alkalitolerans]|uniref:Cas12f1-like TNB domain-containing protein n=1 Tax=Spinactinospora alkalitolerans TaxID=687207 RepID=A0A852TWI0_9ACTN|nr:zinc ribbon domain-containing protein [Spinactinospora alkalitolerans]NYE47212.1 hypothetical protein [Spinactinospora alkalitolerans]
MRFRWSCAVPENVESYRVTRDKAGRRHLAFAVIPAPITEKVDPAYTPQICGGCGHCAPENRESQAVFWCVVCGHREHADVNAAEDILTAAGRAVAARGSLQARPGRRTVNLDSFSPPEGESGWNPLPTGEEGAEDGHLLGGEDPETGVALEVVRLLPASAAATPRDAV